MSSKEVVLDSKKPEQLKEKPKTAKKRIVRLATMGNSRPESGRKKSGKRSGSRKREPSQASASDLQSMAGQGGAPGQAKGEAQIEVSELDLLS